MKISEMRRTEEQYNHRNQEKQELHFGNGSSFFVNTREIWFVKMWINVWYEENGKEEFMRSVVVLRKVWNMFICLALTSKWKDGNKYYYKFQDITLQNPKYKNSSYAILSQIKSFDKKRFVEKVGIIPTSEYSSLTKKLRTLLF